MYVCLVSWEWGMGEERGRTRRCEARETIERCFSFVVCAGFRGGKESLFSTIDGYCYMNIIAR